MTKQQVTELPKGYFQYFHQCRHLVLSLKRSTFFRPRDNELNKAQYLEFENLQ